MGGNKKNKRGSIPSSYSPVLTSSADPEDLSAELTEQSSIITNTVHDSIKIELVERTPENDYGVLSDPEENDQPSPVPLLLKAKSQPDPTPQPDLTPTLEAKDEQGGTPTEPSQPSHVSQDSQQSSQSSQQEQPQSIQPQISQTPALSKSLSTVQLKLSTDKSFSRKITLHTFFSYIILAIEIQRSSCTDSIIARVSIPDVEALITYMIEHHSASEGIQKYLQTLRTTGVIKNLIEAVIEFNKDQTDAVDKLLMTEQIELEMAAVKEDTTATPETTIPSDPASANPAPQTPQQFGFFKRLRCFWSGCCGCK